MDNERPGSRGFQVILWGLGLLLAISVLVSARFGESPYGYLQLVLILLFAYHLALRLRTTGQRGGGAEEGRRNHPCPPAHQLPCPSAPLPTSSLAPLFPLIFLLLLALLSLTTTVNYALTIRHFTTGSARQGPRFADPNGIGPPLTHSRKGPDTKDTGDTLQK